MSLPMPWKTRDVYLELRRYAKKKQVASYSQIASKVGLANQSVRLPLYYIWGFCHGRGIPHISAIAVNKQTKMPAQGYPVERAHLVQEQQRVFGHKWPANLLD